MGAYPIDSKDLALDSKDLALDCTVLAQYSKVLRFSCIPLSLDSKVLLKD